MNFCKYVFCFLLIFFVSTVSFGADKFTLLVYGDSLSAGYRIGANQSFAMQLQNALYKKGYTFVEVLNKSKSGETTAGGLKRLPSILDANKIDGVLLELGINDVFRGYAVSTIENNLTNMIELFKSKNIPVLLVGMKAPPYTSILYQREFDEMYSSLAKKYNLILYPFFMEGLIDLIGEGYQPKSEYILADKIHPNKDGVGVMVNNMLPYVERFLSTNRVHFH